MDTPHELAADDFIASGEAAQMLGVSVTTIANWAAKGLIPGMRLPSDRWRFRRSDIEAAITSGLTSAVGE